MNNHYLQLKLYDPPMFKIDEIWITISNLKIMNNLKGLNHRQTKTRGKNHLVNKMECIWPACRCFTTSYFICSHNNALCLAVLSKQFFFKKKSNTQRGQGSCPGSHSCISEGGFKLNSLWPKTLPIHLIYSTSNSRKSNNTKIHNLLCE